MSSTEIADGTSPIALPGNRYPTGWFQVSWSDDIGAGDVRRVHYFGREIVLWRAESGELHANDAYCLHLGGHLGVGGVVEGEELVCPWHHWHWDGEGRNTLIPESAQKCKENLRLEVWPVREWYGCVLLWHDRAGRDPLWEPPVLDDLESGECYPITPDLRVVHRVKAHPQMVIENGADATHVKWVHGNGAVPEIRRFDLEGHRFYAEVNAVYGAGKESTWLTPDGPVNALLQFNLWGIGQGVVRFPKEILGGVQITNVTPIDEEYSDYWFCMTTQRESAELDAPSAALRRFIEHQMETIEQDFFTWENMKVDMVPNFTREEAQHYAALRRWAWQFYPQGGDVTDDAAGAP